MIPPHSHESARVRPMHGDVWRSRVACRQFTVLHVCGRFDPPVVTGFWWGRRSLRDDMHDAISLPQFLSSMDLIEREDFDV